MAAVVAVAAAAVAAVAVFAAVAAVAAAAAVAAVAVVAAAVGVAIRSAVAEYHGTEPTPPVYPISSLLPRVRQLALYIGRRPSTKSMLLLGCVIP